MMYAQAAEPFSMERFRNPDAIWRDAPFWSWNTEMTRDMIEKQVLEFKSMGLGGFHVHVRVGLKNRYLSGEFMDLIRFCDEKARENGMLCWLYDEDRYPSGIAGGQVTRQVRFRERYLKLTRRPEASLMIPEEEFLRRQAGNEKVRGCFLRAYEIRRENGWLKEARMLEPGEPAGENGWYLVLELAEESPWHNHQTYLNPLNPDAVDEFIRLTHEKYAGAVGEEFGKSVPAIFTDEPRIPGLRLPRTAEGEEEILLPWTETLAEAYGEVGGKDFWQALPWIVWNREGDGAAPERYRFYRVLSELFAGVYCRRIGDWCRAHGLRFTGHLLGEDSLEGIASTAGDALLCYREFDIPGMDNLCDHRDFSAAKQAASIAHQYGKDGVMSEEYGVTQWDFDFRGYKLAGDWQAALGVTLRVPHLAWASMNGEAKRDYPAAIGWQSPWYRDYAWLADHFARVNYCMNRGKPVVRVAVLHPTESFWILQGPDEQCADARRQLEEVFRQVTEWLLEGCIDFDYIAESSLEDGSFRAGKELRCGGMAYEAVVVPGCIRLRGRTAEMLNRFAQAGGKVFFTGETPRYTDAGESPALEALISAGRSIPLSRRALTEALEPWREILLLDGEKTPIRHLLYQLREDQGERWLFIGQAYHDREARQVDLWRRKSLFRPEHTEIRIRGRWRAEEYDTLTGAVHARAAEHRKGWTVLRRDLYWDDSLLLRLLPTEEAAPGKGETVPAAETEVPGPGETEAGLPLPEAFGYEMSEPNALLLDRFEYALDEEEYHPAEEMLRLDTLLRKRLGWPLRCEAQAQPYLRPREEKRTHTLRLRTVIHSETRLSGCFLALEERGYMTGTLNGEPLDFTCRGYYVDRAIARISLPVIREGDNELCLSMAYGEDANPEWMYVLGDFGVQLQGARAWLTPRPERLCWGDYTRQGFPFYTGNMTYLVRLPGEGRRTEPAELTVQVPWYAGTAVKISLDGGPECMAALLPRACRLTLRPEEEGILRLTCLGNRYNGFGQLHLVGDDVAWLGPDSWRSSGTSWTDVWQLRPMGILSAPLAWLRSDALFRPEERNGNGEA